MREFAEEYLRRCDPYWKPSGRKTVRIYLKARILPAFGKMPVDRIGPEDVAVWFDAASKDRPGAANRAFEILRSMMFRAEEWGLRERGANPCVGIRKNPKRNIARFRDTDELARLGRALDDREAQWPQAVAAIRLLARHRRARDQAARLQDRPARGAARRSRASAYRGAGQSPRPGCAPVPAPCRRPGSLDTDHLLARGLRGCEARQAAAA